MSCWGLWISPQQRDIWVPLAGKIDVVLDGKRQAEQRQGVGGLIRELTGGGENRRVGQARDPNRLVGFPFGAGQHVLHDLFRSNLLGPVELALAGKIEALDSVVNVIRLSCIGIIPTQLRVPAESQTGYDTLQLRYLRSTVFRRQAKDRTGS